MKAHPEAYLLLTKIFSQTLADIQINENDEQNYHNAENVHSVNVHAEKRGPEKWQEISL